MTTENKFPRTTLSERIKDKKNDGLIIELGQEVILKEIPAQQIKATSIQITSMVDNPAEKTITIKTNSILGTVVLWEGEAYDAIGQWTDENVKTRLIEIINNKK